MDNQKFITLCAYQWEFEVPKEWLLKNITESNIDDFLNNYTWDESVSLYYEYAIHQRELNINNIIQHLKDGRTFFKKGKQEGIFHDCTYQNYKYQFSYFDKIGPVGDIQKNSIEEMARSIVEYGFEPCEKEELKIIK